MAGEAVQPGVTTEEIDRIAYEYIIKQGAKPNFLNYNGFPATACISINDEVIHGIPSKKRVIKEGDIVSIDLGAVLDGYNGDNAATFAAGKISPEAERLINTTRESLYKGIAAAVAGHSKTSMTMDRYAHARHDSSRRGITALDTAYSM